MDSKSQHGYSLIELVVAVALAGILAAIALPGWNKLLPSYQLDSSIRQFQSELHNIKMRAAVENIGFQLVYTNGAANYTIQRDSAVLVDEAVAGRCGSYKRRCNLFLAKRNRERQPNPAAKLRWEVQTSGGESDRQSSVCKPSDCSEEC